MKITILGTGGAINDGLPYNSFAINSNVLCESPPDIMPSLAACGMDYRSIETVFISHLHADHCFGLPFLLLKRFLDAKTGGSNSPLCLAGPAKLAEHTRALLGIAFGPAHPSLAWCDEYCTFLPLNEQSSWSPVDGYAADWHMLDHFDETYGFVLSRDGRARFACIPDTLWCGAVERMLSRRPDQVLLDLNGSPDDPHPVHMSEDDLVLKGLPLTDGATMFHGTHLRRWRESAHPAISFARQGDVFIID
jgi:phosphoribosyl 1,2-cyclic phosphodiesterase